MITVNNRNQTVLVVEDDPFNRDGLVWYLQSKGYQTLEAADKRSAIELAAESLAPLAIVDIVLPELPGGPIEGKLNVGLDVVRTLKRNSPDMGIVIFTAYEDRAAEVWAMVRDGMRGLAYLLKGNRAERIDTALNEVAAGNVLLETEMIRSRNQMASELVSQLSAAERPLVERAAKLIPTLTPRQLEVARRVAASHTNQSIARALGLAPVTIESYVANTYKRLGLRDVDESLVGLRKSTMLAKAFMLYQLTNRQ